MLVAGSIYQACRYQSCSRWQASRRAVDFYEPTDSPFAPPVVWTRIRKARTSWRSASTSECLAGQTVKD